MMISDDHYAALFFSFSVSTASNQHAFLGLKREWLLATGAVLLGLLQLYCCKAVYMFW